VCAAVFARTRLKPSHTPLSSARTDPYTVFFGIKFPEKDKWGGNCESKRVRSPATVGTVSGRLMLQTVKVTVGGGIRAAASCSVNCSIHGEERYISQLKLPPHRRPCRRMDGRSHEP
jgi:hypothetical protein